MRRRSDTPFAILVIGILTVVFFGGGIVYFTGNTPILKLKAELERDHPGQTLKTRLLPGNPPHIELEVSPELAPDALTMTALGLDALDRYRKLAERTRVESCVVRRRDAPEVAVTVDLPLQYALDEAQGSVGLIMQTAQKAGVTNAEVAVLGAAVTGAHVSVRGKTAKADAAVIADRAVAAITSLSYVGRVQVVITGPKGQVQRGGGRDGQP